MSSNHVEHEGARAHRVVHSRGDTRPTDRERHAAFIPSSKVRGLRLDEEYVGPGVASELAADDDPRGYHDPREPARSTQIILAGLGTGKWFLASNAKTALTADRVTHPKKLVSVRELFCLAPVRELYVASSDGSRQQSPSCTTSTPIKILARSLGRCLRVAGWAPVTLMLPTETLRPHRLTCLMSAL